MGNCNKRALFAISSLACLAAEICFLSVIFLVPRESKKEASKTNNSNTEFCWSNFESKDSSNEVKCPYFALFLAMIVNGILLLFTASFLLTRLLGSKKCSLIRIPVCRIILRYGSFVAEVLTGVLVLTFIGLIIGFNWKAQWTGGILDRKQNLIAYFIITCLGFVLVLVSSVATGINAFRRSRTLDDDFEDRVYRSYSDHSSEDFDIN